MKHKQNRDETEVTEVNEYIEGRNVVGDTYH
jgi:hypothetical protein